MPQLDVATYSSQIFWLVISLSMIFIGLRYIFIPRLESSMDARKRKIEKMLHDAEKLRFESNQMDQKYSEEIKKLHLETYQIHKEEISKLEKEITMELKKLSDEQDKAFEKFMTEIQNKEKLFKDQLLKESDKLLDALLHKFLAEKLDKKE